MCVGLDARPCICLCVGCCRCPASVVLTPRNRELSLVPNAKQHRTTRTSSDSPSRDVMCALDTDTSQHLFFPTNLGIIACGSGWLCASVINLYSVGPRYLCELCSGYLCALRFLGHRCALCFGSLSPFARSLVCVHTRSRSKLVWSLFFENRRVSVTKAHDLAVAITRVLSLILAQE